MKKFLKVLGAAALIAGFTPYYVEKNEETGERKIKALLWQASKKPNPCGDKDDITIKFLSFGKDEDEAHLFTDELTVDYCGKCGEEAAAPEDEIPVEKEEASEDPEVPEDPETSEVIEESEEPEEPVEADLTEEE